MEVELLCRRPNAQLVALPGGLCFLRLSEFVRWAANVGAIKATANENYEITPKVIAQTPQGHQVDV